jgi:hypothetical protein
LERPSGLSVERQTIIDDMQSKNAQRLSANDHAVVAAYADVIVHLMKSLR